MLGNEFFDACKINEMDKKLERIGYITELELVTKYDHLLRKECAEMMLAYIDEKRKAKVTFFIPKNPEKRSTLLDYLNRFDITSGTFDGELVSELGSGKITQIEDDLESMGVNMPNTEEAITSPDNKLEHLEITLEAVTILKGHYSKHEERCEKSSEVPKNGLYLMKKFFKANAELPLFPDDELKVIASTIALMNREKDVGFDDLKQLLGELDKENRILMSKNYLNEIRKFEGMLASLTVTYILGKAKPRKDFEEIELRQINLLLEEVDLPDYESMIKNLDLVEEIFKEYMIGDIAGKLQPYIDAASLETGEAKDIFEDISSILERVHQGEDPEKILDEKLSELLRMFADPQGKNDLADLLEVLSIFKAPLIKKLSALIAGFEKSYYGLILDPRRCEERKKILEVVAEEAIGLKKLLTQNNEFTDNGAEMFATMYLCKEPILSWPKK